MAEAVLLTALIGQTIKLRWKLSLQIRGRRADPADRHRLLTRPQSTGEPARLRAYASFDADRLTDGDAFAQLGEGYFALLLDQGDGTPPYQGITPLAGNLAFRLRRDLFRPVRAAADPVRAGFGRIARAGRRPSIGGPAG